MSPLSSVTGAVTPGRARTTSRTNNYRGFGDHSRVLHGQESRASWGLMYRVKGSV